MNNVIYGIKRTSDSRLSNGYHQDSVESKCDLFVYHVKHTATISGLRSFISDNGISCSDIRIDLTSHQLSEFKSFRVIAPEKTRDKLLCPDFWPIDVRVKAYREPQQKRRNNYSSRGYQPRPHYYYNK